jgi:hypothetical protein
MATPIDEGAVVDSIRRLPTDYLECRIIGHQWEIRYMGPVAGTKDEDLIGRADAHDTKPDGVRLLGCMRCEMERVDLCIVGYGFPTYSYRLVGRQYRVPDNYHIQGGRGYRDLMHTTLFDRYRTGRRTKGKR